MITLDTSGVLAALAPRDPDHDRARETLASERGSLVVPAGALSEIGYMIDGLLGPVVLRQFVDDIRAGYYELDCGESDLARIGELLEQFEDLDLGLADAAVAACAERRGGRVLTFDERDFAPLERAGVVYVVPR